jgi:hypothetical protein
MRRYRRRDMVLKADHSLAGRRTLRGGSQAKSSNFTTGSAI